MNKLFKNLELFRKAKSWKLIHFSFLALILLFISACTHPNTNDGHIAEKEARQEITKQPSKKRERILIPDKITNDSTEENETQEFTRKLKVHYINVGQGDSTLIELPNGKNVLIDGATRSNGPIVMDYLDGLNIQKIDYLIATHPHEDHIGGLVEVVKQYEIGEIFMPKKVHPTIVFEDLLLIIKEKGYSITKAETGVVLFEDDDLSMNILAPLPEMNGSNINNYSIANRLVFKNTAFVFTGDAEQQSEKNMVESGQDLEADVLKIGHHGGDTSSISSFLSAVNPDYGIISAGKDNHYRHPHINVLNRLADRGVQVFRTDQDGTVIASSDGEKIEFNQIKNSIVKTPNSAKRNSEEKERIEVYRTDSGSKYHQENCHTLKNSKVAIPLGKAKAEGLVACGICKPAE